VGVVENAVIERKLVVGVSDELLTVGGWVGDVLLRIAGVDMVLLAGNPIELEVSLVTVGVGVDDVELVADREVIDRLRIERRVQYVRGRRAERARNLVIQKRLAAAGSVRRVWIVELLREVIAETLSAEASRAYIRKVPLTFRCGKDRIGLGGRRLVEARTLVIDKKEELVFNDGTTNRTAELVPAKDWLDRSAVLVEDAGSVRV
jgi:hypothetical protein